MPSPRFLLQLLLPLSLLGLQACAVTDPVLRQAIADASTRPDAAARARLRPYAEQGNAAAIAHLCIAYGAGMDTYVGTAERVKAFGWCRQAAEAGNLESQFYLGQFYAWGLGTPEDKVLALHWYQKAADRGHHRADDAARGMQGKSPVCRNWLTGCRLI